MADIVTTQITASAVVVYLIEALKNSSWFPRINHSSDTLNRTVAGVMAAATALGIHTKFDAEHGTLIITGLTLATIAHFGFEWLRSLIFQEIIYKGVLKPRGAIRDGVQTDTVAQEVHMEKPALTSQSRAATA